MNTYERYDYFSSCECMCHDHILHFTYFPPQEGFPPDEDDIVIYATISPSNYYERLCPPILGILSPYEWSQFFEYHFCRRFIVALKYIFNKSYVRKNGLSSGAIDIQFFDGIYDFLCHITDEEYLGPLENHFDVWLDTGRLALRLMIDRYKDDPYEFGWETQFPQKQTFFKRVVYAWRYIWGLNGREQCGSITPTEAKEIKAMIRWIQDRNKTNAEEKDEVLQPENQQM